MWKVLINEFIYHKTLFLIFMVTIPALVFVESISIWEDAPLTVLTFNMTLLLSLYWNIYRNREKRDYQLQNLPLASWKLAVSRYFVVVLSTALYLLGYVFIMKYLLFVPRSYLSVMLKIMAIILVIYSVYFIIRDIFMLYFRQLGVTKERLLFGAVVLGLVFNLFGIFAFVKTRDTGGTLLPIEPLIRFLVACNPFAGDSGLFIFVLFAAFLGGTTILSYQFRRAYLE